MLERQRLAARIVGEEFGKLVNPLLDEIEREGGIRRLREENLFTFSQSEIDTALNFGRAVDALGQAFSTGLQSAVLEGLTDVIEDLGREEFQQSLSSIGTLLGNSIVLLGNFSIALTSFVADLIRENALIAATRSVVSEVFRFYNVTRRRTDRTVESGRVPSTRRTDG